VSAEKLAHSEARALASVNGALARVGGAPLSARAQQLETDEDFLATFPELDSYSSRPSSGYWGPRVSFDVGADVQWPASDGKRIAVYIKQSMPHIDTVIDALAAGPHRVAAFIPDLNAARTAKLRAPNRIVSERAIKLGPLLKDCDLLISHGGNICPGALMSGVPQLVFPTQYEQFLTAHRIVALGAGAWVGSEAPAADVIMTLDRLTNDPSYKRAAQAYAAKYPGYSPAEQQRRILNRLDEILAKPARPSALPETSK
jgi:UDP:flavonoid glycosyltransferase YjiC (YdhE family)